MNASREAFGPSFYNVDNMVRKYAVIGAKRGSRGGSAGGARQPLFAPNSLKSPLNWPRKTSWGEPPNPLRPLLFQILDTPLAWVPS